MTGHEPLIAMRRRGLLPGRFVHLTDAPDPGARVWHEGSMAGGFVPSIELSVSDSVCTLDLRFLVGLTVVVLSIRGREGQIHRACVEAGAAKVVSVANHEVQLTERKNKVSHG